MPGELELQGRGWVGPQPQARTEQYRYDGKLDRVDQVRVQHAAEKPGTPEQPDILARLALQATDRQNRVGSQLGAGTVRLAECPGDDNIRMPGIAPRSCSSDLPGAPPH